MAKRKVKEVEEPPEMTKSKKIKSSTTTTTTIASHTAASRYTPQQERAVAEYCAVTQADRSSAAKILKQVNWNVSAAVNTFFSHSNSVSGPIRTKIGQIFDGYRENPQENELGFEGVTQILGDLEIGLEDIGSLVFFEIVQSPQLGKITREGFVDGFADSNADTLAKMRNTVLSRRAKLSTDRSLFKNVYNHTFALSLEGQKKGIDLEQATELWKVLFSQDGFQWDTDSAPWLEWYIEYLNTHWKKAINKDLWRQTLAFAEASNRDQTLSFWTEESSWPSVIDEFVEWVKTEKKIPDAMQVEQ